MKTSLISFMVLGASCLSVMAQMKVVALHPLIADLATQVGGEHVEVISLMRENDDPHHFNPTPATLHGARGAKIYLASGMGLESFLGKLSDTLGYSAIVIEVGSTLPARKIDEFDHGHKGHHHGQIDPHWWHRVSNMQRAADVVAKAFTAADPDHAADYKSNTRKYQSELSRLNSWIRRKIMPIPKEDRKLATAHASFEYFCAEYGFQSLAVKGINKAKEPSAKELAEIVKTIRTQKIKALFPEQRANPKALKTLSKETGVRIGGTLIADGSASYIKMMKHNVKTIVETLTRKK